MTTPQYRIGTPGEARSESDAPAAPIARRRESYRLQGAKIEVERWGRGRPILLLQSEDAYEAQLPLLDRLAETHEVILPWAPGYGRSSLPDTVRTIDDIAYIYLDLMDLLDLRAATLIGFSVGGWIAAEIATKTCARLAAMVLVAPLGIKFGGPFDRDIADIYFLPAGTVRALRFADPEKDPLLNADRLSRRAAICVARHRETTARLCWEPYFHNPALKNRLHRIAVETLLVWGSADGLATTRYGRAFARRIPGAGFTTIGRAGHYPHIERPDAFLARIAPFLATGRPHSS